MSIPPFKLQQNPKIIAIVGPTASGKTSLAIAVALRFASKQSKEKNEAAGAEIISADSRQVYRGLDIGSGKVTEREMRGIPHHLLDIASPRKKFTVAQFQKRGYRVIKKIIAQKKIPIIVGGTGLYVDALIYDRIFPTVKPDFALREKLERKSTGELFAELQKLGPRRAGNIDRHNPRRLIRALEIALTTKKPIPSREETFGATKKYDTLFLGISVPEKKLAENIHKRLLERMKHGMVREVERLRKSGVSWKRLDDLGLEYRYIARYLQGQLSKTEMLAELEKEIRRYAKRQMTWFRKDTSIVWVRNQKEAFGEIKKFL